MHHVENKVELRHGAHQLGFQEGRPLLLQGALPPEVTLREGEFNQCVWGGVGGEDEESG